MTVKHPAPYSESIIFALQRRLSQLVEPGGRILDPMAGIGRVHQIHGFQTVGVELEPEWAASHPDTIVGDARHLPFADETFDGIVTSPCYGNRMADSHNARDASYRRTYTHLLGRQLTEGNAGALQWGDDYRTLHELVWAEVHRVLRPGGVFALNIKDHIRDKKRIRVTSWHFKAITALGFDLLRIETIPTPHFRFGENRQRCAEKLLVFRKASDG